MISLFRRRWVMRCAMGLFLALTVISAGVMMWEGGLRKAHAQGPQAACRVDACAANCLSYQYVLGMGNLDTFIRWYDTAFRLAGCGDPDWWQNFTFLLAVAADIIGAPGGYTLDCRSMVLGQYDVCLNQCKSNPCRYAPNVRAQITGCSQGVLSV